MTQIVFASGRMTPPLFYGGAEISTLTLAKRLQTQGARCTFVGTYEHIHYGISRLDEFSERLRHLGVPFSVSKQVLTYEFEGMLCLMGRADQYRSLLKRELRSSRRPGVVVTQLEFTADTLRLARRYRWKRAVLVNDCLELGIEAVRRTDLANLTIYGSDFVLSKHRPPQGSRNVVFHTHFDRQNYLVSSTAEVFTFVNPLPIKGLETFLAICRRLPQIDFLAVQGWSMDLPQIELPNVTVLPQQLDMRVVYGKTMAVLMPSLCEEAFGRLPVEAAFSGIPTIASNLGGLPESVGEGGILLPPDDVDAWVDAIKRMLDKRYYRQLSQRAAEHSKKFEFDWSGQFLDMVGA
jgi:glycosyltransferase involved in cell wall biosynthesis